MTILYKNELKNLIKYGYTYLKINLNENLKLIKELNLALYLLKNCDKSGRYVDHLVSDVIYKNLGEIYNFGMNNAIQEIINEYSRKSLIYRGFDARVDYADSILDKTRFFHIDHDGDPTLKLIIYLNNTKDDGGAFTILPEKFLIDLIVFFLGEKNTYRLIKYFPFLFPEKKLFGYMDSMVLVDTTRLWHKGSIPVKNRYSIFFSYSTFDLKSSNPPELLQSRELFHLPNSI